MREINCKLIFSIKTHLIIIFPYDVVDGAFQLAVIWDFAYDDVCVTAFEDVPSHGITVTDESFVDQLPKIF